MKYLETATPGPEKARKSERKQENADGRAGGKEKRGGRQRTETGAEGRVAVETRQRKAHAKRH